MKGISRWISRVKIIRIRLLFISFLKNNEFATAHKFSCDEGVPSFSPGWQKEVVVVFFCFETSDLFLLSFKSSFFMIKT